MSDDAALLRRYVEEGSESAFATLVERHVSLVYAAALRRTGGRVHLAKDVAQHVFTSLARNARSLTGHPALAAWLHTTTRNAALNLMKAEQRRRTREHTAATDPTWSANDEPAWEEVRPWLDDAIDQLGEADRVAIVQRFLEQRDYAAIAATFRSSPDAARMRTERALEKLRRILQRRGVKSTSVALGIVLGQQAMSAAPAGLAAGITTAAIAAAPVSGLGALATTILMSNLTTSATAVILGAGLTTVIWNTASPAPGPKELAALRAEHTRLLTPTEQESVAAAVALDRRAEELFRILGARHTRTQSRTTTPDPSTNGTGAHAANRGGGALDAADVVTSSGHRNRGQETATDAQLTFAWAADVADLGVLAKLIWFDEEARAAANTILAGMPPAIRAEYPTPEALYALFLAAETQLGPPPGPEWFARLTPVQLDPTRVGFRRPDTAQIDFWQYQRTDEGWKAVIPANVVPIIARNVLNDDFMSRLATAQR